MTPSQASLHPEKTPRIRLRGRTRASETRVQAIPLVRREAKSLPSNRVNESPGRAARLHPQTSHGVRWEQWPLSLLPGEHISARGAFYPMGKEREIPQRSSRKAPPKARASQFCSRLQILAGAVESRPRTMVRLRQNRQKATPKATREGHQAVEIKPRDPRRGNPGDSSR